MICTELNKSASHQFVVSVKFLLSHQIKAELCMGLD